MNIYFALLTLPFLQLGYSYYLSGMVLSLALLVPSLKLHSRIWLVLPLIVCAFFGKYVYTPLDSHDMLEDMRELLCFALIYLSINGLKGVRVEGVRVVAKLLFFVVIALVLLQEVFILSGQFIGFPIEWFVMNEKTLEGIEAALHHGTRVRPTGFYGEPSYCGFVLILLYYLLMVSAAQREKLYLSLFALIGVGVLQSMSTLLILIYLFAVFAHTLFTKKFLILFLGIVSVFVVVGISTTEFSSRISKIIEGEDVSVSIRFLAPLGILANQISNEKYLGMAASEVERALSSSEFFDVANSIDNGILAQLIGQGLGGVFALAMICKKAKSIHLAFLFILLAQVNGSVFSLDKVVLFSLLFGLRAGFERIGLQGRAPLPTRSSQTTNQI